MVAGVNSALVLLVFVISVTQFEMTTADQRQKVIDFHTDCLDAHGVEQQALIEALEGTVREDEDFYNHLFCAAKQAKVMSDDGTVNIDNFEVDMKDVIDSHNMANVVAILRKCLVQREDITTTIREAIHCFAKEDHGL